MKKTWPYIAFPILGVIFCLWYVQHATFDIVYTDYIRLVNTYLPDVMNPDKFFVPDVLTRIPVNYLGRMINVVFFHYSTTFDMILGVLGLGAAGGLIACYCRNYSVNWFWLMLLSILLFGLNKWEMLTNGTGWVHFLAIACFLYHYLILDRVWYGTEKRYDRVKLMILPFIITLGVAGPYCAIYTVVLVLSYGFCMIVKAERAGKYEAVQGEWPKRRQNMKKEKTKRKRMGRMDFRYLLYMVCAVIPLFLYMWSNSYAVEDHAGMQDLPLVSTFMDVPGYFVHFFLKSLASDLLEGELIKEWIRNGVVTDQMVYVLGVLVLFAALLALWMNFRYRLYKTTVFPLMLLVGGGLNHLLILYSRWGFMDENYGMSSRYALQFQFVTLGIVLTTALAWEQIRRQAAGVLAGLCCVAVLSGSLIATQREIHMAPHREDYGQNIATVALQYKEVGDDVLQKTFDYRKSEEGSGAKVRNALRILDENNLNIYSRQ